MKIDLVKLKICQARACLSIDELSEKTRISRTSISKILNGHTTPNIKNAGLIAKALNVDITEIIIKE